MIPKKGQFSPEMELPESESTLSESQCNAILTSENQTDRVESRVCDSAYDLIPPL